MEFSTNAFHNIIKQQGDKRVSEDSANELRQISEDLAGKVGKKAVEIAEEKGRKTVRKEDIREALREVNN